MKKVQRFDSVQVKAHFDEHGFLVDRPIVACRSIKPRSVSAASSAPPPRFSRLTHWRLLAGSLSLWGMLP